MERVANRHPSDPSTEVEDGVGVFVRNFNPIVIHEEDGSPLVLDLAGDESPLGRASDGNAPHLVGLLVETDKEGGRDYGGGFLEGSLDVSGEFSRVVHNDYHNAEVGTQCKIYFHYFPKKSGLAIRGGSDGLRLGVALDSHLSEVEETLVRIAGSGEPIVRLGGVASLCVSVKGGKVASVGKAEVTD
jgi:hypothetical protein